MLEKKQIQAIFYSSSKWLIKQQRQLTTSTMHLAQELLMNLQCSHGSRRSGKERRALKLRLAIGTWQRQPSAITEAWSSSTTREIAKELNTSHSTVIWHLKQIGKVKKWQVGASWADRKSKKSSFWIVIISRSRQKQWTISWSDCDMQWKVGFIQQLAMISSVIGLRRTSKALPKAKFVPEKVIVTVWWSTACLIHYSFLNPSETITCETLTKQIEEMHWNLQSLHPILINRKGPIHLHDNPQRVIATASKVEQTGLRSFASTATLTWLLANWLPLLQPSQQDFAGKMLPQPAGDRKRFPRVSWIPKHEFLHRRNKQTSFLWAKMYWL